MKAAAVSANAVKCGESRQIDAYIAEASVFAQPVLNHLRKLVHRASPEIEEAIKWKQPFFLYRGSLLCFMAAFKHHCSFGFWGSQMAAVMKQDGREGEGKGSRGAFGRITSVGDLPPDKAMLGYLRQAIVLAEGSTEKPSLPKVRKAKPEVEPPPELIAAMQQKKEAAEAFASLTPGCRREYINWIVEAKRPETKQRRIDTTVQLVLEGKSLNWKYESC